MIRKLKISREKHQAAIKWSIKLEDVAKIMSCTNKNRGIFLLH